MQDLWYCATWGRYTDGDYVVTFNTEGVRVFYHSFEVVSASVAAPGKLRLYLPTLRIVEPQCGKMDTFLVELPDGWPVMPATGPEKMVEWTQLVALPFAKRLQKTNSLVTGELWSLRTDLEITNRKHKRHVEQSSRNLQKAQDEAKALRSEVVMLRHQLAAKTSGAMLKEANDKAARLEQRVKELEAQLRSK